MGACLMLCIYDDPLLDIGQRVKTANGSWYASFQFDMRFSWTNLEAHLCTHFDYGRLTKSHRPKAAHQLHRTSCARPKLFFLQAGKSKLPSVRKGSLASDKMKVLLHGTPEGTANMCIQHYYGAFFPSKTLLIIRKYLKFRTFNYQLGV